MRCRRPGALHVYAPALVAILLLLPTAAVHAQAQSQRLRVTSAWIMATPPTAKVAGAFLTITNTGPGDDRLTGASVERAGAVEIHEMRMVNGVMMMAHDKPGILVKAGTAVTLKPFSHHLMLMDIARSFMPGDRIKGTLAFEKGGAVDVEFSVEPMGSKGPRASN